MPQALEELLELVRREEGTEELQKLPYRSLAQLVQEVSRHVSGESIELARRALARLVTLRIGKIMRQYQAGGGAQLESLLTEEGVLLAPLLGLGVGGGDGNGNGLVIASFRGDYPGLDSVRMVRLGPFRRFDLAVLPRTDAAELARKGVVDITRG